MNLSKLQGIGSFLGRILFSTIFLMSAVGNKIPNFTGTVELMSKEGIPMPSIMLVGAILFLIVGSGLIIAGYRVQIGAGLLGIFLILATYFFHDFWMFEGDAQKAQMIQFMKNMSLFGALIFICANGPGAMSIGSKQPNNASVSEISTTEGI